MDSQNNDVIVFDNLIGHKDFLMGKSKTIEIAATPFTQRNANGELIIFDNLELIGRIATESGKKTAALFTA